MLTIIGISLICLVLSTRGDEVCSTDEWGINICKDQDTVTRVSNIGEYSFLILLHIPLTSDTAIGPNAFSGLNILDLRLVFPPPDGGSSLHLLSLKSDSFTGLSKLTILMIENARVRVSGNPLASLESLEYLQVKNCSFKEVPTDLLASLPNLKELSLENNQIRKIQSNAFVSVKHLETLNLRENNITSIESGGFNGLNELQALDLSSNSFTAVDGMFRDLDQLIKLDLSDAFIINGFDPSILRDMPELSNLRLSKNNLTELQPGMFNGVPQLSHLLLHGNSIRHVPKNVFGQLEFLMVISLADNQIETIEPLAFSGLNLSHLNFVGNKLKKLETNTFNGLDVDSLILKDNDIDDLEPRAFNGLTARVVYLSDNKLTTIDSEDLSGLATEDLDLRGNVIVTIASDAFENAGVKRLKIEQDGVKTPDGRVWSAPDSVVLSN